ncbi:alpha-glucuronidase [Aurantiacibacter xanthus]|uniref:Alpha-glucuronidase n=1 Tax=Aurantiacibacter xanthus TaxID=1784712 RepID=A0A3A1NZA0_9SPHN|nr:alpha-glucuronidase [Aurantiacibacter xanthus]RIV81091.1 alpha-glucuronidase [Aurantiacibacter xanthus]
MLVNHQSWALRSLLGLALVVALLSDAQVRAEDGYDLWLRHEPVGGAAGSELNGITVAGPDSFADAGAEAMVSVALAELRSGLAELAGGESPPAAPLSIRLSCTDADIARGGAFALDGDSTGLTLRAGEASGCLYGAFALLRLLDTGERLTKIHHAEAPAMPLRLLNHWDNPDGTVERGYAGSSIFDWWHLPDHLDRRMIDYARANASVGINGVVVNNVNASAMMLEPRYIARLARLADAWRPYGIRVYLTARFSAPRDIGGLDTADPIDPAVARWWQNKADEIYAAIPDFGGFLVKANSEGQPGPGDYGRTHAEGANMLASAIGARGTVFWRAFVYAAEDETDRASQAYREFAPLDGAFADNVIVQVKNGPIDFQPREPFHPLFGAMRHTRVALEAQITKEYLGFATHVAYLAPLWKEVLDAETGHGGTVASSIAPAGMAGVANIGTARNWSGSHFDQANWYAFGRLAWNPQLSSEEIAREWLMQTFSRDPAFVSDVSAMMLNSRELVVDYMTPLGLAHLMATGHHYGPGPWVCDLARPEWNPCYYHRADKDGIGFDRTASGTDALADYAPSVAAQWAEPETTDPRLLLWFHHVPWDWALPDGKRLWPTLVEHYDTGVAGVAEMQAMWAAQAGKVDPRRHGDVTDFLAIQAKEARWWRDASIAYWQSLNGLPLPAGSAPPEHDLADYRARDFPEAPSD